MPSTSKSASLALFLVSFVTLVYELTQIRVFAYSLHPLIAYSAIALAMLGFGLGAIVVAIRPAWFEGDIARRAAIASLALGVSIPFAAFIFARTSPFVFPVAAHAVDPLGSAVALLPGVVPYALAGIVVTLILRSQVSHVGRTYFWNLAGSALGCLVVTWLLRWFGAERVMLLCGAAAAAVPLVVHYAARTLRFTSIAVTVATLALVPFAPRLIAFRPDPSDLIYLLASRTGGRLATELSTWDPVGRIDIVRHDVPLIYVEEPVEYRTITNDSGAMSLMMKAPSTPGWGRAIFEDSLYGVPYRIRPPRSVLVIGVGGGTDIETALHWNAAQVTGVDVSLATLDALQGPYAEFAGWPKDPRVTLIHEDGRSFAHRTSERFDLVQLTGVDTFTMHSASAMVTAEDFLYTREAFAEFISLLAPEGLLAVTRFGDEAMNLSAIAVAALRKLGIDRPQDHIAAVQQAFASGVVVKRTPFTPEELARLRHIEDRQTPTGVRIPHYDESGLRASEPLRLLHPAGRQPEPRYDAFFAAVATASEPKVLYAGGNPFVVPTDDRPYYMLGQWTIAGGATHPIIAGVRTATLVIGAASLALIVLPLIARKKRGTAPVSRVATMLAFFFAIGAAFMLLEVGLIHRTIVFVGSPGAAVSVVIASILLSASIGAAVSDRFARRPVAAILIPGCGMVLTGVFFRFGAAPLFELLFGLPMSARIVSAALALTPAGFFAGWFFPGGMRLISAKEDALVPWAIGVNAFASVLGSLATLALGIAVGFEGMFAVALALYVCAVLVLLPLARKATALQQQ